MTPTDGVAHGQEFKYYDGSRMLRYRPQGSRETFATIKLKKGQTTDEIPSIILSKLQAQGGPQGAKASSTSLMDAHEPGPVPAEDPERAPVDVPAKRQRAQPEVFSPSKHWSGYERARLGERHGRVRMDSFADLQEEVIFLRAFQASVAEHIALGADGDLGPDQAIAAVSALQVALSELIEAADDASDDDAEDIDQGGMASASTAGTGAPPIASRAGPPRPRLAPSPPQQQAKDTMPRGDTKRIRLGRELKQTLKEVCKLQSRDKMVAAAALLEEAAQRSGDASEALAKKRAGELQDLTFTFGDLKLTRNIISNFLELPLVKRLLPEELRKKQAENVDAGTAKILLEAARDFFNDIMATRGRRSDEDRNAFWAGLVALIPANILEDRRGRAAMRLLNVQYRHVKQATILRTAVEQKRGWTQLVSSCHKDRVDLKLIREWWHTDAASMEDNMKKEKVKVFHDGPHPSGSDEANSIVAYEEHMRRLQLAGNKESLSAFKESPQYALLCEETKTARRPNGVQVGIKLVCKARCPCVKRRAVTECDCTICSFVIVNLPIWHRARGQWRAHADPPCACAVCASEDDELSKLYWSCTSSIGALERALTPCGLVEHPDFTLPDAQRPFRAFKRECVSGKCAMRQPSFFRPTPPPSNPNARVCGWDGLFAAPCPLETESEVPFKYHAWEPRLRSKSKDEDKADFYSLELTPQLSTRKEFLVVFSRALTVYMEHVWRVRMSKQAMRLLESWKLTTTLSLYSDFAAQIEFKRVNSATCASPERFNCYVMVAGFKPRSVPVKNKKGEVVGHVRQQTVVAAFCFFESSYKPDARALNIMQEDFERLLATGTAASGEWFMDGVRVPTGESVPEAGDPRGELVEGLREGATASSGSDAATVEPLFKDIELVLSVHDGAPTQFANRTHHHQTAIWRTKMGWPRLDVKLITMHGKGVYDGLGNMIKMIANELGRLAVMILPGARAFVMALAKHYPDPSKVKNQKSGYWKVDKFAYAYYDKSRFTRSRIPDAGAFAGSSKVHMSIGLCQDADKALRDGPLYVSDYLCGCIECARLNFKACKMRHVFGPGMRPVKCPKGIGGAQVSQSATLAEFALKLGRDQLVAFRVADDEEGIEGPVWLAVLNGPHEILKQDVLFAGQTFQKGWYVVRGHWFSFQGEVADGDRRYTLLRDDALFNVNSMIRVENVAFTTRYRRGRGAPKEWLLNAEMYEQLLECV